MKTTKAQYKRFCNSFRKWQAKLNCLDYKVTFVCTNLPDDYARIEADHTGRVALVKMTDNLAPVDFKWFDPELHGKHEAIHLFLFKLARLAHRRDFNEVDLAQTEEGMVRILEKLL